MKNLICMFGLCSIVLFAVSCQSATVEPNLGENPEQANNQLINSMPYAEYQTLNDTEKQFINLLNVSINGLQGLSLNAPDDIANKHYATFNFSKNEKSYVVILEKDMDYQNARVEGDCLVCGFSSGVSCVKSILKTVDSEGSLDVTVSKKGECYEVSW